MTSSGLLWKCYSLLFFGFMDETPLLQKPLSAIPDDFNGVLLDVPVGTGYFNTATYKNLSQATILAVDHSMSMLRQAQNHYAENGIRNVILIRADVANLPIQSQCVDRCLSMAGLHAFPDKDRALQEMARVLKPKGGFSGRVLSKENGFRRTYSFHWFFVASVTSVPPSIPTRTAEPNSKHISTN